MKCFNHAHADAVGLCKNCQKALCHDCLVDCGNGVACKNNCEEKVKLLDAFFNQNIYNRYNHLFMFRLIFGVLFMALGAYFYHAFSEILPALIFAGVGFASLAFALVIKRSKKP